MLKCKLLANIAKAFRVAPDKMRKVRQRGELTSHNGSCTGGKQNIVLQHVVADVTCRHVHLS